MSSLIQAEGPVMFGVMFGAMFRRSTVVAVASLAMAGIAAAGELTPGSGRSIRLGDVNGTVYYTIEEDGYRVVATLASEALTAPGTEATSGETPIRFIATLAPGQSLVIQVPQAVGEPSLDFEIERRGETLLVGDPISAQTADLVDD